MRTLYNAYVTDPNPHTASLLKSALTEKLKITGPLHVLVQRAFSWHIL